LIFFHSIARINEFKKVNLSSGAPYTYPHDFAFFPFISQSKKIKRYEKQHSSSQLKNNAQKRVNNINRDIFAARYNTTIITFFSNFR